MQYKQLNSEKRYTIEKLLARGESQASIAEVVGVAPSTISREVKRNTPTDSAVYYSSTAEYMSKARSSKANSTAYKLTEEMKAEINECLEKKWSPEQIVGRYRQEGKAMVSHETIYKYVYSSKEEELSTHLRRKRRKRQKRSHSYKRRGILVDRVSIEQRPQEVEEQSRYGDWEGDTIVGKGHKSYLVTLTERKSNFNLVAKIARKESKGCVDKIIEMLDPYKEIVHTLTVDNGKEFAEHKRITEAIGQVYFAHPYSSYERGCNENQNGLIRQYLKKGSCFKSVPIDKITRIQQELNERPRKKLNFKTPQEVMIKLLKSVALQT